MQAQPLQLPDQPPFIGRGEEIRSLLESIRAGARLITIAGPSGMGKSRLATQLIDELADDRSWRRPIQVCRLEGVNRSYLFQKRLLAALGGDGARYRVDNRELLLLLDDLEPALLGVAATALDKLLDDWPHLQLLVTSLAPLGVEGELRFELGPLPLEEARELYLERAHRFWAGRPGSRDDGPAIEALVERLDGIPLAIELAAAKVRVLPPRALIGRLGERFELLQSGLPGRHGSLFRAVERTWDLLSAEEKLFAAKASIFRGGFSLEAAEAVIGDQEGGFTTLTLLSQLRDKGLIRVDESVSFRYLPFETFREFASLRLRHQTHEKETIRRHALYFLREGERRLAWLRGGRAAEALDWIATEHENLMAAHRRCLRELPSKAARLGLVAGSILGVRELSTPEATLVSSVIEAARSADDPSLLVRAFLLQGKALQRWGRLEEARLAFEEGLALARTTGERLLEGLLVSELASGLAEGEAASELDRVRAVARELEDRSLEARAMLAKGNLDAHRGEFEAAREHLEEALQLVEDVEDAPLHAQVLAALGGVYAALRLIREARSTLRKASTVFQDLGDRGAGAQALLHLSRLEQGLGRLDQAAQHAQEALGLSRTGVTEAEASGILGQIALVREEPAVAEERLATAVAGLQERGTRRLQAEMLAFLAAAAALQDRQLEGQRILGEARALFDALEDRSAGRWVELLQAAIDVHRVRHQLRASRSDEALIRQARERAAAIREEAPPEGESNVLLAHQLLEQALAGLGREESSKRLTIGPGAAWFSYGSSSRVNLHRRRALRRLLSGLVDQRLENPGVGLGSLELFRLGWIGEDIGIESATARVYTGIWTLRSLGLGEVLMNKGDGYMLDPEVEIERFG